MEIFDEFIVVDEKVISELTVQNCSECISTFRDVTQFAALEFVTSSGPILKIKDIGNAFSNPPNLVPLAQIVSLKWDKNGAQQIISMMKEKQQRMITLDELGVDMDQFKQFLEAISDPPLPPNPKNVLMLLKLADYFQVTALKSRCETHLINCVEIPLIDRFLLIDRYGLDNLKVTALKSRCETHLINCVEIPLIDRFLLIDRYGLDNLKNYFLHLDVNKLCAFFNAKHEQFFPVISKEFLYALSIRGMAGL